MFRVGQKVVCVNDVFKRPKRPNVIRPIKGTIYHIRNFDYNRPFCEDPIGVRLIEIINPILSYNCGMDETSFPCWRFKPVRETDISIFTAMLNPVTNKENA